MISNHSPYPVVEYSLDGAHSAIAANVHPLNQQQIAVSDGLYRINAAPLLAFRPNPLYNQSTRDGFALSSQPLSVNDSSKALFKLVGEVAAGSQKEKSLKVGETVRIMTGAMIPFGCVRVVPFEDCIDQGGTVEVPVFELNNRQRYIRFLGSEVKEGKILVSDGTRLLPDHLLMLAENGLVDLSVYRRPEVAVICTGSELVDVGEEISPGQKISGNGVLLSALLKAHGVNCSRSVTVPDQVERIEMQIMEILAEEPDMIISTGGMGPGKYDLMEQVFACLGGVVVYNRLQVRPGKFTLFGMIGRVPFFALPGPPSAVRILYHELIVHALNRLQGGADAAGNLVTVPLATTLSVKQTGHLNLKGAVVQVVEGGLLAHPAGRMEPVNAIIHLEKDRMTAGYGETVKVRLVEPSHGLAV